MMKIFQRSLISYICKNEWCFWISNANRTFGGVIKRDARRGASRGLLRRACFVWRLRPKHDGTEQQQTKHWPDDPRTGKTARLHLCELHQWKRWKTLGSTLLACWHYYQAEARL